MLQRRCTCKEDPIRRGTWSQNKSIYFGKNEFRSDNILYIPVIYHVIYSQEEQNINIDLIQNNHLQLNTCFAVTNSDIDKVPTSGNYNYAHLIGEPHIAFQPINENQIIERSPFIRRTNVNQPMVSLEEAIIFSSPVEKYLNVYIGNMPDNILGEAYSGSNLCMVNYRTVGGSTIKGNLEGFDLGKTLVHEVGHCFTLSHPWDSKCLDLINDLPRTKNPNYNAILFDDSGSYSGKGCNHWTDVEQLTLGFSCTGNEPPPNGYYELFMTYMEYVTDLNMVMFTQDQSVDMYIWLGTEGRMIFTVQETDILLTISPTNSSSSLNTVQIILIVLVTITMVILIAIISYYATKKQ
jgi:hypothetical protein